MTQTEMILADLKAGNSISSLEALKRYGCFRLAARINDLRNQGFTIHTTTKSLNGKSFALYTLKK